MAEKLTAVKGMNDILPADSARWEWFEDTVRRVMARYGYRGLRTPIVEPTALFVRGLGEVTDIVEKEMYSFEDSMNGDRLTLRPEATAGMVRAINEHNALYNGPLRVWQMGPMFRHERPQKGRYRQFHQLDVEAFGHAGPDVDAELILMVRALWRELGLKEGSDVTLEINSLGQPEERKAHRAALIAYLEANAGQLDEEAKRRLHSNPLRILDTKNPAMQALVDAAPRLMDFLGEASLAHFNALRAVLDAAGLAYRVNPRLVRGMDYYNLTVFEWVTPHLGSQATVCGGGRYDQLIEQLGGKPAPGVGFGLGIERLLLLLEALELQPPPAAPDAYAVVPDLAALPQVMPLLETLRAQGLAVVLNGGGGSMKSQFKKADASGARWALVFGADELARGEVALKPLRDAAAAQSSRSLAEAAAWAGELRNA
ncbi:histidine--tRNA ligase [Rubrivivax rivuli]|uniref:Histidine--tRNA ligase n=1 Tax=Rubrivivax rivuli TaxID=1862385 RepID=A0A437RFC5_9BURK|nr:histidine--tRNA ligase [Rubrivivax rivuli]RVU45466.1 histidine--tRNA ligase [Rubrivivax rivuli]